MKFQRKKYSDKVLLDLYQALLWPRLIEEKMLILLRQNKISKWFSGIGQEAISVGITQALRKRRIHFAHASKPWCIYRTQHSLSLNSSRSGKELVRVLPKAAISSFHFGTNEHHIVGMISHLGPQNGVADGIALASKLKGEEKITVVFNGDGGTSQGDFHEAINVAAVWNLPVIFVIENNGYGLSTPSAEQFKCKQFIDKAIGYGIEGVQVDGNNVLEVYDTDKDAGCIHAKKTTACFAGVYHL
jgi:2-oxoisovalerate dehydrogenase E1 component